MLVSTRLVELNSKHNMEGDLPLAEREEFITIVEQCRVVYEEHFRRKADTTG